MTSSQYSIMHNGYNLHMPNWVIAVSYFVHLIATVIWVGGIAVIAMVVYPGARRVLGDGPGSSALMIELHRRFSPLAMIALAALIVTGLAQMAVNKNYQGFLNIGNVWAVAILLKHLAFAVMTLIGVYSVWGVAPALARLALLESKGKADGIDLATLRKREERLNQLNLGCALLVLLFTAVARSI